MTFSKALGSALTSGAKAIFPMIGIMLILGANTTTISVAVAVPVLLSTLIIRFK